MEYVDYENEMGRYRFPNRLYENHIKGLDLLVKSLKKKYPFVTGKWSLWRSKNDESNDNSLDISIPLIIQIDLNKLYTMYDFTTRLFLNDVGSLNVIPDDDETTERLRAVDQTLKSQIERTYSNLPEEFRIQGEINFSWETDSKFHPVFSRPYLMSYEIVNNPNRP
jgi:hypothetical protein